MKGHQITSKRASLIEKILIARKQKNIALVFNRAELSYQSAYSDMDLFFPESGPSLLHYLLAETSSHHMKDLDYNALFQCAMIITEYCTLIPPDLWTNKRLKHFLTYVDPVSKNTIGHAIAAYARCGDSCFQAYLELLQSPVLNEVEKGEIAVSRNAEEYSLFRILANRITRVCSLRGAYTFVITQLHEKDVAQLLKEPDGLGETIIKSKELPDKIHLVKYLMGGSLSPASKEAILLRYIQSKHIVYSVFFLNLHKNDRVIHDYFQAMAEALFRSEHHFSLNFNVFEGIGRGALSEREWLSFILSSETSPDYFMFFLKKANYSFDQLLLLFSHQPAIYVHGMEVLWRRMSVKVKEKLDVPMLLSFLLTTRLSSEDLLLVISRQTEVGTFILDMQDREQKLDILTHAHHHKHTLGKFFDAGLLIKSKWQKAFMKMKKQLLNETVIPVSFETSEAEEVSFISVSPRQAGRFMVFGGKQSAEDSAEDGSEDDFRLRP